MSESLRRSAMFFAKFARVLVGAALIHPAAVGALACGGDCNADGDVTVNELVAAVNVALENSPITACVPVDTSGDGTVTVNEVVAAVNNALYGCPQVATPTPSPTATATPFDPSPTLTPT